MTKALSNLNNNNNQGFAGMKKEIIGMKDEVKKEIIDMKNEINNSFEIISTSIDNLAKNLNKPYYDCLFLFLIYVFIFYFLKKNNYI